MNFDWLVYFDEFWLATHFNCFIRKYIRWKTAMFTSGILKESAVTRQEFPVAIPARKIAVL